MDVEQAASGDPVLRPFLETLDPAESDRLLDALLTEHVDRAVRDVIRRSLGLRFQHGAAVGGEDAEDVRGDVLVLLVRKLRRIKAGASEEPIADLQAYAATVASHACHAALRRRRPAWTRLRNQVRYLMTHDSRLSLNVRAGGLSRCLLAGWRHDAAVADVSGDERALALAAQNLARGLDPRSCALGELMVALLAGCGRPAELNELVTAIADLRGIQELSAVPLDADPVAIPVADVRADVAPAAATDDLRSLWDQVCLLPLRQRLALLLNLRDADGEDALALLPASGVASIRRIAEVLDIPAVELARLWKDLPLDDRRIADRLGATRQQVINLRKAARERLVRRLVRPERGRRALIRARFSTLPQRSGKTRVEDGS